LPWRLTSQWGRRLLSTRGDSLSPPPRGGGCTTWKKMNRNGQTMTSDSPKHPLAPSMLAHRGCFGKEGHCQHHPGSDPLPHGPRPGPVDAVLPKASLAVGGGGEVRPRAAIQPAGRGGSCGQALPPPPFGIPSIGWGVEGVDEGGMGVLEPEKLLGFVSKEAID